MSSRIDVVVTIPVKVMWKANEDKDDEEGCADDADMTWMMN